ncbi:hypothetical protein TcBrA4_0031970 [Trypanosoma cruzi]|nr:hypothetical protein TcBrA4_0031970 [Trypanosoma cruzi]
MGGTFDVHHPESTAFGLAGCSTTGLLATVVAAVCPFLSVRGHRRWQDRPCRPHRAAQATIRPAAGNNMMASSACLPPSLCKEHDGGGLGWAALRGRATANGRRRRGTQEAWDRNIPSDSSDDTIARRCTVNALQAANSGERTRYTERQGSTRHRPFEGLCRHPLAEQLSLGSDRCIILLLVPIGDDDTPTVVLGLTGNY